MGPVVLDTGVIVAWFNTEDAHHGPTVERLGAITAAGQDFAISIVSYAELLTSRLKLERERSRELADALGARGLIPVDREIAERAAELRLARKSLRTPDALIAATSDLHGAGPLLTTDRSLARLDGAEYIGIARR
ncbi:MAG: PIN domain-containing protein [Thermoleophilaceae bacterium]|nr:PIN domain-containing protein [Thermoleophilaceae bacterium]